MLETILIVMIFILGIYFGSFFTLATYRIPKNEDITHKNSYCPSCNHKLLPLDLIPVFSYIFLGGKCRYCSKPIGIRYFMFEILTGLTFVLFAISLKLNVYSLNINIIIYYVLSILYFSSLFILGGIEKEKGIIQKSVLVYGIFVSLVYMIYSYALVKTNVYEYIIYLCFMTILLLLDIKGLKRELKYNYSIQILILILYMLIVTGIYDTIYTIFLSILAMGIQNILKNIKNNRKLLVFDTNKKTPVVFYLCISNILVIIITNFIANYLLNSSI